MRIAIVLAVLLAAAPGRAQTFRRPVACDACIANWYYFDNAAGGLQDWSCATSTYDGHRGSDFSLAGGNGAIDAGHDVVAVAAGTVVSTEDGHYDRCTTCSASVDSRCGSGFGSGYGNHVVINHGAYRTIYAHLRTGSVRVSPGDTVSCGQTVGQIGSSGCTTGAHLHLETRPLGGGYMTAFDPFQGGCSPTSPSLWTSQGPHRGMPEPACDGTPTCPSGTYPIWTCEGAGRRRCVDGMDMTEPCPYGCVSMPVGTDDVCAEPPDGDGDGSRADGDCDDADAGRFPGNMETCGDGVDQDCDGGDLACPGMDAGVIESDAGAIDVDAAVDDAAVLPGQDAAVVPVDGAVVVPDPDGGALRIGMLRGTCTCRATEAGGGAAAWALPVLIGLALGRRRAHRRQICPQAILSAGGSAYGRTCSRRADRRSSRRSSTASPP